MEGSANKTPEKRKRIFKVKKKSHGAADRREIKDENRRGSSKRKKQEGSSRTAIRS